MPTREEFLEKWPLYTNCDCEQFHPPKSISLDCKQCGKETTWPLDSFHQLRQLSPFSGFVTTYACGLCKNDKPHITFVIRSSGWEKESPYTQTKVQKIGQYPSQSVSIGRDLEKRLGESAPLYKNALTCRNVNFGIGALAYIRRVIEDKCNELIEVIAIQAESFGENESAKIIRAAKDERMTFDERLRLAAEAMPASLKPNGANPLAALYGLLSNGLHAKSEEDCIGIVDETRDVFEYVFARLRAEIEDRNAMMAKVKKWIGKNG